MNPLTPAYVCDACGQIEATRPDVCMCGCEGFTPLVRELFPDDLTARQFGAFFAFCDTVRRMAMEGACEREIGEETGARLTDVRQAARVQGFCVSAHPIRQALCPKCGAILNPDGSCHSCALHLRIERLHAVLTGEQERGEALLDDSINALKQKLKRLRVDFAVDAAEELVEAMLEMKAAYLMNPRMRREEWAAFEEATERLLEVAREQQRSGGGRGSIDPLDERD